MAPSSTTEAAAGSDLEKAGRQSPVYFLALDFYRFLAALGVVMFHYLILAGYGSNPNLRHLVDFFFILSGFVMMHTYLGLAVGEVKVFLLRRFARIYPLHLLTFLFFLLYGAARSMATGTQPARYASDAIIPNLLMVHAWNTTSAGTFNFPSWSISSEWFVYLLFPLFLFLFRRTQSRSHQWTGGAFLLGLALALGAAMTLYDIHTGGRSWTLRTYDWGAIRAVPSFLLGMAIRVLPIPRLRWVAIYPIGAAYAGLYFLNHLPGQVFILAGGVLIALTSAAKDKGVFDLPQLKPLSDASYGIYLLHICIGVISFNVIGKRLAAVHPAILVALSVAVTIVAAIICYNWFERPARNWIRRAIEPRLTRRRWRRGGSPG